VTADFPKGAQQILGIMLPEEEPSNVKQIVCNRNSTPIKNKPGFQPPTSQQ